MNSQNTEQNLNIEAGWKTYLKAAVFVLPAIIAWGFACVFLVPKLREICSQAGMQPSQVGWLWDPAFFLVEFGRTIFVVVVLLLAVLELFGRRWARHRRVTVGIIVWVANLSVLFGLTALLILALIAAPALAHGK
jgi:type II secretory pathway component PulF